MPSFVKICPPVPEKIFEEFLPYMGVAAILSCDQDAVNNLSFPLPNLALIGQAVSEEKMFEIVNGDDGRTDGRTTDGLR